MHPPDALPVDAVPFQELGAFLAASRHGNTARRSVEIGIGLLVLKKSVSHGEFQNRVDILGGRGRTAARYMALARRFRGAPDALFEAVGNTAKLLVLLRLDGEECAALARGEAVAGLTLERVAQMTAKELRGAVRSALLQVPPLLTEVATVATPAQTLAAVTPTGGSAMHKSNGLQMGPAQWQALTAHWVTTVAAPEPAQTAGVDLTEVEARMLRYYRQCTLDARLALLQVARVLCQHAAP